MSEYAQILFYAIPFFFVLITIEWLFALKKGTEVYNAFDTISSLSSGLTNSIKDVLGLSIVIISYTWLYGHLAIYQIQTSWLLYIVAFIVLDFAGYWSHRLEHVINILWNRHIIHHSSEEFNLACALRQPISSIFAIFTILILPAALLGIPPRVIAVVAPLHLFAQFWYHTRLIGKMGVFEYIIVTPSHHRVHHAINDVYLDRNFGQVFIVWDKLFGTFQAELVNEQAVFGVKKQVNTWNPILINWQHITQMIQDAYHTKSWSSKMKIWFMPTGWRPEDVKSAYPITYVDHPEQQSKYTTNPSLAFKIWSGLHLIITITFLLHFFTIIDEYSLTRLVGYGAFIVLNIYSYTSLMDRDNVSIFAEILKTSLVISLVYMIGTWFGVNYLGVFAYSLITIAGSIYFLYFEKELEPQVSI